MKPTAFSVSKRSHSDVDAYFDRVTEYVAKNHHLVEALFIEAAQRLAAPSRSSQFLWTAL
jgi:hypothetical protein